MLDSLWGDSIWTAITSLRCRLKIQMKITGKMSKSWLLIQWSFKKSKYPGIRKVIAGNWAYWYIYISIFCICLGYLLWSSFVDWMKNLKQAYFTKSESDGNGKKQSYPPKRKQIRPPCSQSGCAHTARSGSKFCIRVRWFHLFDSLHWYNLSLHPNEK